MMCADTGGRYSKEVYVMEEKEKEKALEVEKEAEVKTACCCPTGKSKHRDKEGKEYKSLICRLNRIEGQIRGIRNMVENDRYCVDILMQVSAVQSALNAFNKELLAQHINGCVIRDIRAGKDEVVDELVTMLQKLMK